MEAGTFEKKREKPKIKKSLFSHEPVTHLPQGVVEICSMPVCYSVSPAKYVLTSDEAGGARPRGMPARSPPYFTLHSCTARRIPASAMLVHS